MGRGRPKKDGRYDYREATGYRYYVKVIYVKTVNGKSKRKPVRARTLEELDVKVSRLLGDSTDGGKSLADVTVGQWVDHWLKTVIPGTVKSSTQDYYTYMLGYLPEPWRKKMLNKVVPSEIQRLLQQLRLNGGQKSHQSLSSTTVRGVRSSLIACFEAAVDEGLITVNTAKKTKPPIQDDKKEITFLTADEIHRLLAVADSGSYYDAVALDGTNIGIPYLVHQWAVVIRLTLATGLRRGEVFGLTWDDVNTEQRTINVRYNLQGTQLVSPKTKNSRRTIVVDADTARRRADWRAYQQQYATELGDKYSNRQKLLFTSVQGSYVNVDNFRQRAFEKMLRKAGISPAFTFHGLRHTHATQLLAAGVDAKTVSKRLGHSSVAFTLQTYTHVLPDTETRAADAIGRILEGKSDGGS